MLFVVFVVVSYVGYMLNKHVGTYGEVFMVVCAQRERAPPVHWHHALKFETVPDRSPRDLN